MPNKELLNVSANTAFQVKNNELFYFRLLLSPMLSVDNA